MTVIDEFILVKILRLLAKYYPGYIDGNYIIRKVGEGKVPFISQIVKCLPYTMEEGYVDGDPGRPIELGKYGITSKGIHYLERLNKEN